MMGGIREISFGKKEKRKCINNKQYGHVYV